MRNNTSNQHRNEIINYLKSHPEATRKELQDVIGVSSKQTISNLIKELIDEGYPISTPHGKVILNDPNVEACNQLDSTIIRKWIILFAVHYLLETLEYETVYHSLSYDEIYDKCTELYASLSGVQFSDWVFNQDLRELVEDGYLYYEILYDDNETSKEKANRRLRDNRVYYSTGKFPEFIVLDNSNVNTVMTFLDSNPDTALLYREFKLTLSQAFSSDPNLNHATRDQNIYSTSAIKSIHDYLDHPFDKQCLDIDVKSRKGKNHIREFMTGIIIYSIEKNRFYILGKGFEANAKYASYSLIRADHILSITDTDVPNTIYRSEEIMTYHRYILDASIDGGKELEPKKVEFFLINSEQNYKYIESLCENRNAIPYFGNTNPFNSKLNQTGPIAEFTVCSAKEIDSGSVNLSSKMRERIEHYTELGVITEDEELIRYTDTILGFTDLLPIVRFLGDDIQVISPQGVIKRINKNKEKHIARYEEILMNQYGEDINGSL